MGMESAEILDFVMAMDPLAISIRIVVLEVAEMGFAMLPAVIGAMPLVIPAALEWIVATGIATPIKFAEAQLSVMEQELLATLIQTAVRIFAVIAPTLANDLKGVLGFSEPGTFSQRCAAPFP